MGSGRGAGEGRGGGGGGGEGGVSGHRYNTICTWPHLYTCGHMPVQFARASTCVLQQERECDGAKEVLRLNYEEHIVHGRSGC